jgi:hypothetical protein
MAEQRLWAPWRLDYIKGPKPDVDDSFETLSRLFR